MTYLANSQTDIEFPIPLKEDDFKYSWYNWDLKYEINDTKKINLCNGLFDSGEIGLTIDDLRVNGAPFAGRSYP